MSDVGIKIRNNFLAFCGSLLSIYLVATLFSLAFDFLISLVIASTIFAGASFWFPSYTRILFFSSLLFASLSLIGVSTEYFSDSTLVAVLGVVVGLTSVVLVFGTIVSPLWKRG